MKNSRGRVSNSGGFALVEVLVTFAVLSFGLIALAGLQLVTLKHAQSSGFRSIATIQANSLAEVMRGNRVMVLSGGFNNPTGASTAACFGAAGCTPRQMALTQYDIWQQTIAAMLPGGVGVVCVDSTPADGTPSAFACDDLSGAPYVIKVFWTDDKQGTVARFTTAVNP